MGFNISDFWEVTPSEFETICQGYAERKKDESDSMLLHAFFISRWVWAKKLDIKKILGIKSKPKKQQTDDDMLKIAQSLNKMFNGTIQKGGE